MDGGDEPCYIQDEEQNHDTDKVANFDSIMFGSTDEPLRIGRSSAFGILLSDAVYVDADECNQQNESQQSSRLSPKDDFAELPIIHSCALPKRKRASSESGVFPGSAGSSATQLVL